MSWLGKVAGGVLGFMVGGPPGAAIGVLIGHQVDTGRLKPEAIESGHGAGDQHRVQMAFFKATFSVMGHIAKSDGRVTEAEIRAARGIMNRMELPEEMRQSAIQLFNAGKEPDFPLESALAQFRSECFGRRFLFNVFIEIQLEAALSDGLLQRNEELLLLRVCDALGISRTEFYLLKSRMEAERRFSRGESWQNQQRGQGQQRQGHGYGRSGDRRGAGPANREPSLADAYAVLGLQPTAGKAEVKRAYRKLMSQHHPDKLVASGVPEEMVRIATEKTQQVQKAYEIIAKARNF